MAMKITEDCTACGACAAVCPNDAINEGENMYVIDPKKCKECEGAAPSPQCKETCPVDCIAKA